MRLIREVFVVSVLLLLWGCATTSPPPAKPGIEILSNTMSGGKGSPWGRSDSTEEFTKLTSAASDPAYGLTEKNPIKVGGFNERNEAEYLNGLRGPAGEPIEYERIGSCCPFKTPNAQIDNIGLLDAFRITYPGRGEPFVLYIDFYDEGTLYVPLGFSPRRN
jgi:hypothetical protein